MLIGREKEKQVLQNALYEEYSQFVAVYGRRLRRSLVLAEY